MGLSISPQKFLTSPHLDISSHYISTSHGRKVGTKMVPFSQNLQKYVTSITLYQKNIELCPKEIIIVS